MKLEETAKSTGNINRTIRKSLNILLLFTSIVTSLNCGPTPKKTPVPQIINEAPDTQVTRKFNNDGTVEYTISATDDGFIGSISVRVNDGDWEDFYKDYISVSVPIKEGNNTVEARAYDDKGKEDPTPAMGFFVSPTEEEAKELIDNILAEKSIKETYSGLEENVKFTLGETDPLFYVDYLIKRESDGKDVVINYVGYGDNLEEELNNKELLDLYGIPNRYFFRIPEIEINSEIRDFIDNGYNQNDE